MSSHESPESHGSHDVDYRLARVRSAELGERNVVCPSPALAVHTTYAALKFCSLHLISPNPSPSTPLLDNFEKKSDRTTVRHRGSVWHRHQCRNCEYVVVIVAGLTSQTVTLRSVCCLSATALGLGFCFRLRCFILSVSLVSAYLVLCIPLLIPLRPLLRVPVRLPPPPSGAVRSFPLRP